MVPSQSAFLKALDGVALSSDAFFLYMCVCVCVCVM